MNSIISFYPIWPISELLFVFFFKISLYAFTVNFRGAVVKKDDNKGVDLGQNASHSNRDHFQIFEIKISFHKRHAVFINKCFIFSELVLKFRRKFPFKKGEIVFVLFPDVDDFVIASRDDVLFPLLVLLQCSFKQIFPI